MPKTDAIAFFHLEGDWFVGNDPARGPWHVGACHAGPVTGVIARALEDAVPDKQLTRLTVTFRRPVPMAGFRITADIERDGRNATSASATLLDREGKVCAAADSLHLVSNDFGPLPTASVPHPDFDAAEIGEFPVERAAHGEPFFFHGIEVAYPLGETGGLGPTMLWMRTLPLIDGEAPSPFQLLCPLADCGNGISRNADVPDATFVNPDLTVVVYRLPESEWLAADAMSFWEPTGIGMSQSTLYDTKGAIGVAIQTLLVKPENR